MRCNSLTCFFCISILLVTGCSSTMSLYEAIRNDDANAIEKIAKFNKSILSAFSFNGNSPLLYAMEQGSKNAYLALLEGGANPNEIGPRGANLMTFSAGKPDVFWLKKALEHGGDPNLDNQAPIDYRSTPLMEAANDHCLEGLKLLIDVYRADIDYVVVCDDALVKSSSSNNFQAVLLLLEAGANFRRKTGEYRSFANAIMRKKVQGFLLEKDQRHFQAVIDWLHGQGVEWDKPQADGEIWSYSTNQR